MPSSKDSSMRNNLDHIFKGVLLLYFTGIIIFIWINQDQFQWDFNIYYRAAQAYSQGLNPYNAENISQFQEGGKVLDFVYPPITLPIFRGFLLMEYSLAYHIFLVFKCLLLIWLILLWKRYFLRSRLDSLFILYCLFGFGGAVLIDIMAGNISIIEQFILWVAFYLLLNKKVIPFGILILAAAVFKVVPILFLVLLLLVEGKRKRFHFAIFLSLFLFIMLISYIMRPDLFSYFLHNSFRFSELGVVNPSIFSLISGFFTLQAKVTGLIIPGWVPLALFICIVAVVLFVSIKAYRAMKNIEIDGKDLIVLFAFCVVYALILPRFKDYSYILLLPPAYFIITKIDYAKAFPILLLIMLLSSGRFVAIPAIDIIFRAFWNYYSLLLAFLVWGLYLYYIFGKIRRPPAEVS
jgi:hypothetical protein